MNLAALARELGLGRVEPRRIGHASNLVVHLHPAPVVARVMTATRVLHRDVPVWLGRVVSVASYLADRDAPVAPPTDLVAPGPHAHEGEWVTLWRWIESEPGPTPTSRDLGTSLRELHAALAEYPGELRPFTDVREEILWLHEQLGCHEDLDRLDVFDRSFPHVQPIHGDVSPQNVLREYGRLLWNDWEDVCVGPVGWDLAELEETGVAAYGDGATPEDLAAFRTVYALYGRAWRAYRRASHL